MFISIACLTTDLVSGAKKKETEKRLSALETAVDQLNDGLEEINSTVQEIKEGKDDIYSDPHPSKKREKETKKEKRNVT